MSDPFHDYRFMFLVADLPEALNALQALRSAGLIAGNQLPDNMLGDPMDAAGEPVGRDEAAWFGRRGTAAVSVPNPEGGAPITAPQRGDPGCFYVHIRSVVAPNDLGLDPAAFRLVPTTVEESTAVLGIWSD